MVDMLDWACIFCRLQVAGWKLNFWVSVGLHSTPVSLNSTSVSLNQLRLLAVSLYIEVYSNSNSNKQLISTCNLQLQPATCKIYLLWWTLGLPMQALVTVLFSWSKYSVLSDSLFQVEVWWPNSALDSGLRGLGSSPGWGSWARYFTLIVPLSTQVYKWVPVNLILGEGVTLRWTSIPSRGE